ncbi:MAG: hypothetical protein M5U28_36005 [Sandaracinaceae bacterium]|nr:hypothetical protein [Sandaracinaceae bacterium]
MAEPAMMSDVLARPLAHAADEATLRRELAALLGADAGEDGPALRRGLRRYRHRAIVRIALREVLRLADVDRTSAEMALLASVLIDLALSAAARTERARHGRALDASGREVPLTVLGMGKLGGLELNLGSDVDLVLFYETDEAGGRGRRAERPRALRPRGTPRGPRALRGDRGRLLLPRGPAPQARGLARADRQLAGQRRALLRVVGPHLGGARRCCARDPSPAIAPSGGARSRRCAPSSCGARWIRASRRRWRR